MSYMKQLAIKRMNEEKQQQYRDFMDNFIAEQNLEIEDYLNR